MRNVVFACALTLALSVLSIGQKANDQKEISKAQWDSLIAAVSNEQWANAFDQSSKLLKNFGREEDDKISRLRYINLYSAAGAVSEGRMTYDALEEIVGDFAGKPIAFPWRRVASGCTGTQFNFVCPGKDNKKVSVTATNKTATSILAFEYTDLESPFDFAKHQGEEVIVRAVIDKVVPNPNRSNLLILRVFSTKGTITLADKTLGT